jgi:acyl carrier protein
VSLAAAIVRADGGAEPMLVAYVVPKQAGYAVSHSDRPTAERLTEHLAVALPEYMVPSAIVLMEELPLTSNGKLDRRALPAPGVTAKGEDSFVPPQGTMEETLAGIWMDVLKKARVGRTDNFLDLGGHSLMAIRILGRISKSFGVRLSLRTLFDAPTLAQLAEVIEKELQNAAPVSSIKVSRDAYRIAKPIAASDPAGSE